MSFFGSFFGTDQRKDIDRANAAATGALKTGYDEASGYYDKAKAYFDPYAEAGSKAQGTYSDALGLNGEAGAGNALAKYRTAANPYFEYETDRAQRGMDRAANARGGLDTGTNALAVARARMGMGYQDYNNWLSRIQGQTQQGMQAAGSQAQLTQGQGDMRAGYGQQSAANAINYGNAVAGTRNIGVNNLIQLGGVAMRAAGGGNPLSMAARPSWSGYKSSWPATVG